MLEKSKLMFFQNFWKLEKREEGSEDPVDLMF